MSNSPGIASDQRSGGVVLFTLRDLTAILFRFRDRALMALGLCLAAAVLASLLLPTIYESDATLLVNKYGRGFFYRPAADPAARPIPIASDPEEILNTQVQLLLSRDVILQTIDQVGLKDLFPDLARSSPPNLSLAVDRFTSALSIVPQRTSNILHVSFRNHNGETAHRTLETLIRIFQEKSLNTYLNSQTRFFETEVDRQRGVYEAAAVRLNAFRHRLGAEAFDRERALLLQQRSDLDSTAHRVAADLAGAQGRAIDLRRQIATTEPDVVAFTDTSPNRVVEEAQLKLLNLRLRAQELRSDFTDSSREMAQIGSEIAIARSFLTQQATQSSTVRRARSDALNLANQDLGRTEAESAALVASQDALRKSIADLDARLATMGDTEAERWMLERNAATAQDTLKTMMSRLAEARTSDAMNREGIGDIALVQAPSLPDPREPVRPRWGVNLALGLLIGLFAALLAALLSDLFSDTVYDTARAEHVLEIPALAVFDLAPVQA